MDPASIELGITASKEALKILGEFGQQLFGPSAEQLGLIVGDHVRFYRMKNLLAIKEKVDHVFQEKGIDPSARRYLKLAVGLPLLEKASYQDDGFLQEMWANLIANSLRSDDEVGGLSLDITYVEILHQLSRLDCEVLDYIVENGVKGRNKKTGEIQLIPLDPSEIDKSHPNKPAHISLEKLVSLGCAYRALKVPLKPGSGDGYSALGQDIVVTLIGLNLCLSASEKKPTWWVEDNG